MELVSTFTGGPNPFSGPDGLGLDDQGDLYVADAIPGSKSSTARGTYFLKWGSKGSKDGQFDCGAFCGLAVDGQGNVYVTDAGNRRVQKFDSDGKFGEVGQPG